MATAYTKIVLIPYERVVKGLRGAGLRSFTKRKLQRWAAPVVEVRGSDGTVRRLGLLSGGIRKGQGRGRGWGWVLPEADLVTATFIQHALDRVAKRTLAGDGLGDAGLWAFLWGAPVPLPVVRHYLIESLDQVEHAITARLESRRKYHDDEPTDLILRLAKHMAYDDVALKSAGVPLKDRARLGEQALAHMTGRRWDLDEGAPEFYARFSEGYFHRITQALSGSDAPIKEEFFEPLDPNRVEEEQQFFSFKNLRHLYQNQKECPDDWLLQAQAKFSSGQRFLDAVTEAIQKKQHIPDAVMDQAKSLRGLYTMLAKFPPQSVMSFLLWGPYQMGRQKGPPVAE